MAAGFIEFPIAWRADIFAGTLQSSSAATFGTLGIDFRVRKPLDEQDPAAAFAAAHGAACPVVPGQGKRN